MNVTQHDGEALYRVMTRIRVFENKTADLVQAGEVKTPCHLYVGQEAVAAGVCAKLRREDFVWGGHRSHGHYLAKGGDLNLMMAEIFCKHTGCSEGRGGSMHLFAPEVGVLGTVPLVAATIPLAVGTALASRLRKDGAVSVSFFGDGATEEGHFHESMNLAAVYKLPVIFVCENNFYASHLGLLERRAADNIVRSGDAHGVPAEAVDGNDVGAVIEAATRAVARARAGEGPSLIECRTFRWRGHVGASFDMDVGVRRKDELDAWIAKDPVARLRRHLKGLGTAAEFFDRVDREAADEVEAAIAFARSSPNPPAEELYRHVYTEASE